MADDRDAGGPSKPRAQPVRLPGGSSGPGGGPDGLPRPRPTGLPRPRPTGAGGGVLLGVGLLLGGVIGVFAGEPSLGAVLGLAIGAAAALAFNMIRR